MICNTDFFIKNKWNDYILNKYNKKKLCIISPFNFIIYKKNAGLQYSFNDSYYDVY